MPWLLLDDNKMLFDSHFEVPYHCLHLFLTRVAITFHKCVFLYYLPRFITFPNISVSALILVCVCVCAHTHAQPLSHVQLFAVLWTVACQTSLSMGYFRQDTTVGCHFLLQGVFPTQGSNPHLLRLLHCRQIGNANCLYLL